MSKSQWKLPRQDHRGDTYWVSSYRSMHILVKLKKGEMYFANCLTEIQPKSRLMQLTSSSSQSCSSFVMIKITIFINHEFFSDCHCHPSPILRYSPTLYRMPWQSQWLFWLPLFRWESLWPTSTDMTSMLDRLEISLIVTRFLSGHVSTQRPKHE